MPKDWQLCAKNTFAGVHVWEFSTTFVDSRSARDSIECRVCHEEPPLGEKAQLLSNYRSTREAAETARQLHEAQRIGTGRKRA